MTEATTRRGMQTCRRTTTSLSSTYRNSAAVLPWMLCASALIAAGPAYAGSAVLPTGGQYVAGQGAISGSTNGLTINQSTSHGIINWQGFSIGAGNTVQFNNGSGATLNRVIGANISQIDGKLNATGSLYLINPQGIVIGPGGKVVTNGSFVASTRDVSNSAFMSGGAMSASGTSKGDVVNAGTITSKTGDAILVGRAVSNRGTVSAANGTAGMAAGNQILLQPAGSDPRIAIAGGTGDVTNTGTVKAAQVELNAAGGNVYALAGNNGGLISATGVKTVDGHIWLTAGGTTTVAGTVSATNADGTGGAVTVRGTDINVSGQINASANATGQAGGNVSVVATGNTTVSGTIKASGGGTIETSGHTLEVGGANVDAGQGGQWLLDPYDLTVDSSAATTIDTTLNAGTDVTLQTTATGTSGPGTANSSGNGDIFISSALSWSTSATLTLDAYRSVDINALVTVTGAGGVKIITNDGGGGGDYSFGLTSAGFTGSLNFTGGSGSGANLTINSTPYTILYSLSDLSGINTSANLSGNYALAGNLDDAGAAWTPLGTDGAGTLLNSGHGLPAPSPASATPSPTSR
ncbi:MAG: filamentous hemagglutinin N-terminal domain-containing protein [Alphaproteobacteria bacterium]|nr:filamentous hemagglutinin N-terminal domain-containing protein [Alphaproteobacteria bacterium]